MHPVVIVLLAAKINARTAVLQHGGVGGFGEGGPSAWPRMVVTLGGEESNELGYEMLGAVAETGVEETNAVRLLRWSTQLELSMPHSE